MLLGGMAPPLWPGTKTFREYQLIETNAILCAKGKRFR